MLCLPTFMLPAPLGMLCSVSCVSAACLLPACLLPTFCTLAAYLLLACCLPATCLPPACCLPAACLLPTCCLPAAYLLPACCLPAAYLLHKCCLPAACLLPACYLLRDPAQRGSPNTVRHVKSDLPNYIPVYWREDYFILNPVKLLNKMNNPHRKRFWNSIKLSLNWTGLNKFHCISATRSHTIFSFGKIILEIHKLARHFIRG